MTRNILTSNSYHTKNISENQLFLPLPAWSSIAVKNLPDVHGAIFHGTTKTGSRFDFSEQRGKLESGISDRLVMVDKVD